MPRRKKKQSIDTKKIIITVITAAILIPTAGSVWKTAIAAYEMGKKQKTYEDAIVEQTEFVHEQRTYNELVQQQVNLMQEDQQRQWTILEKVIDVKGGRDE